MSGGNNLLNWEQKLLALDALAEGRLYIERVDAWRCWHPIMIADGCVLTSGTAAGQTPELAVLAQWKRLVTDLEDAEKWLVVRVGQAPDGTEITRSVRWNGFMWVDVARVGA